jgi:hypothetical protein
MHSLQERENDGDYNPNDWVKKGCSCGNHVYINKNWKVGHEYKCYYCGKKLHIKKSDLIK